MKLFVLSLTLLSISSAVFGQVSIKICPTPSITISSNAGPSMISAQGCSIPQNPQISHPNTGYTSTGVVYQVPFPRPDLNAYPIQDANMNSLPSNP